MSRAVPTIPPPVPYRRRTHAPADLAYRRPLETPARLEPARGVRAP